MKNIPVNSGQRERWIASLLLHGTWFASALIAVGLLSDLWDRSPSGQMASTRITNVGIGVFISLPILRVLLMLVLFLRDRDYVYSVVATIVLAIIAAGFLAGIRTH
jgi:uncharacterized membrane protein